MWVRLDRAAVAILLLKRSTFEFDCGWGGFVESCYTPELQEKYRIKDDKCSLNLYYLNTAMKD